MTTTILAHFDGQHFVPDEPVNLPAGMRLRMLVETLSSEPISQNEELLSPLIKGLDAQLAQAIGSDPEFDAENMQ